MELRRFLPRQFADWEGTYLVEEDVDRRWRDCRVVDISSAGAGIEIPGAVDEVASGNHVLLRVHLRAQIRHAAPGRGHDTVRVGAQFVDLTEAERTYLASVAKLDARW
ncbi:MAG TPA: PilZ domain-containing protein [Acidimicrobiales bacterium]|nr:PilZ domain-containing protein [Acidimicrobiales bacterium]